MKYLVLEMDLHQALCEHFSLAELDQLCFDLGIDHEDIEGKTKQEKARELIQYLDRRKKLHQLKFLCKQERNEVNWDVLFTAYSQGRARNFRLNRRIVAGSLLLTIGLIAIIALLFGGTVAIVAGITLIAILVLFLIILEFLEHYR